MALQTGQTTRQLLGLITMRGTIECVTGLQVGGVSDAIEIGGIDRPVIRDPISNLPYIPGSSLRGKLRSLLEKFVLSQNNQPLQANRPGSSDKKIWRHECDDFNEAKDCPLCRIFGSTAKGGNDQQAQGDNFPSALLVRDCLLSDVSKNKLKPDDMVILEAKTENTLDRLTSAAVPRTFERVPAETLFGFELIYKVESISLSEEATPFKSNVSDDMTNLLTGMELLEKDGLGGSTSRGYGQVKFTVKEFSGCDVDGKGKGGFRDGDKKISECKSFVKKFNFDS